LLLVLLPIAKRLGASSKTDSSIAAPLPASKYK